MRELGLSLVDVALTSVRRPGRRSRTADEKSWHKGACNGGRSRWALKNLPPIEEDDPWSMELTPTEE